MKITNTTVERWDLFEMAVQSGRSYDTPFMGVELRVVFTHGATAMRVDGFYDGDSTWRIRFRPVKWRPEP